MERISTSTAVADLFGAGKDGFRDGNQAEGVLPTNFNADWCNSIQEELANFIESRGIVLDPEDHTQLTEAIARAVAGGDYKPSVRAASTAAINLAAPGSTIDGVSMVAGDRFLEKDHGTPALRGIYIWNGAAVAATRSEDFNDDAEVTPGLIIPVEEGTANADTQWMLTTNGSIIIGTTSLSFTQKSLVFASEAEAQALSSTTKGISPSTLNAAFKGSNQSLAADGYQKLPGGLILQWGTWSGATGGSSATATLPLAAPNGVLRVICCDVSANGSGVEKVSHANAEDTLTTVKFYKDTTVGLIEYLAICY